MSLFPSTAFKAFTFSELCHTGLSLTRFLNATIEDSIRHPDKEITVYDVFLKAEIIIVKSVKQPNWKCISGIRNIVGDVLFQ